MTRTSCLIGLCLAVTACGGQSLSDGGEAGAAGSGNSGAGATARSTGIGGKNAGTRGKGAGTGGGGIAGAGSAGGTGGVPSSCVKQDDWTFQEPVCADLAPLTLTDMSATDSNDNIFKPGEPIQVSVNLNETSGKGFSYYPGVTFTANHPSVFFGKQSEGKDWLYAIEGCGTTPLSTTIHVFGDISPGTEVEVTAQVGMINQECPGANVAKLKFVVQ